MKNTSIATSLIDLARMIKFYQKNGYQFELTETTGVYGEKVVRIDWWSKEDETEEEED